MPSARPRRPSSASRPARRRKTVREYAPEPVEMPRGPQAARRDRPDDDVAGLQSEQLRELYRFLYMTRSLEEQLVALYRQGKVVGGVYRSLGQEATAVGCTYALQPGDIIQPLIRDTGALLVHGVDPLALFRQYMARGSSPTAGRDLNTHFSAPTHGLLGPISMLGAMVPVLAGCLLAARIRGEAIAGVAFLGDGGSSTGAFYEGFNFAVVQQLPLVLVLEANQYAYSTPTTQQVPRGDLITRARGFGCPVLHIDGNDVLACYEATRESREHALSGQGPSIIVADTYRRRGHAEHDNQAYVPSGEIDAWARDNDPLRRFEDHVLSHGHLEPQDLEAERAEVDAVLRQARDVSEQESFPDPESLTTGVYEASPHPSPETWFTAGARHRGGCHG